MFYLIILICFCKYMLILSQHISKHVGRESGKGMLKKTPVCNIPQVNVSWLGIKGATSTTYLSLFNGTFTISLSVAVAENMITKECMRSDMCNRVYSNGVRCCSEDMCNGAQHTGVFVPLLLAPLAVITLFIWNFTSLFVCLFLHYVVLCVHK